MELALFSHGKGMSRIQDYTAISAYRNIQMERLTQPTDGRNITGEVNPLIHGHHGNPDL